MKLSKEAVHIALQAPLRDRFRELPEANMKEILHQRMFESGSYKSLPKQVALYEALEASMKWENMDEFLAEKDKSRKRHHDDQDPLPPPLDLDPSNKRRHDLGASGSTHPLKKLSKTDLEGLAFKVVRPFHNNNISLQFQMEECHRMLTDQVDLVNPEGHRIMPDVRKPLPLEDPPGQIKSEHEYDISAAYGISHWWFKRKEFDITRHDAPSDRSKVRSHMRILSVISLKTYVRYGYAFLKEIILRKADYKEYKISEADFKNLHPNDFEDLYLLHLQGSYKDGDFWQRRVHYRMLIHENPICTLGDYSKPSHEGYRNTIELPVGNNVVPLRSDTIWLVQNGCSFHGIWFEDPNQHLNDLLMDSLDLDGENRERMHLHLFQFSLCDQASNWLERLLADSITSWEDLTTHLLA
nr:zinc finger, CCHC-type [Tanacetum cinerariifolium]